jgi:6-phosphogluconolactonase
VTSRELWIGTYPVAGAGTPVGRGEGVWTVPFDDETGALGIPRQVAVLPSPSFVAARGPWLYAVSEDQPGAVVALPADRPDQPTPRALSGGEYPCHVVATEHALLVANYGSGTLGVVPLGPDGDLTSDEPAVHGHVGKGPREDRQEGPHAHFVAIAPGGRHVLVVDLGTDEVRRYAWDGRTATPDGIAVTFPPGTGPRHLDFSPDRRAAYVSGELDGAVHVLAWDVETATGTLVQSVPAVVEPVAGASSSDEGARAPQGDDAVRHGDGDLPSHLVLDGDQVLLTVRGADVLTRWQVGPDGSLADGTSHALGGHWPRHFAVVGSWLVVALEKPGELVVLTREGVERDRVALPSVTCVVPRA